MWTAAGPMCLGPAAEKGVACLLGPPGDGQKLDEALAWALSVQSCHVFGACLEYLTPEVCFCYCSDKAHRKYLLAAF